MIAKDLYDKLTKMFEQEPESKDFEIFYETPPIAGDYMLIEDAGIGTLYSEDDDLEEGDDGSFDAIILASKVFGDVVTSGSDGGPIFFKEIINSVTKKEDNV